VLPELAITPAVTVHFRAENSYPGFYHCVPGRYEMLFLHISRETVDQNAERSFFHPFRAIKLCVETGSVTVNKELFHFDLL
jgi:hypothetical protein